MGLWRNDLLPAARRLARHPTFALPAVVILALGLGVTTAIYSLIDALLLRPLPVAAPERLVAIFSAAPRDILGGTPLATADFLDLLERSRSFSDLLAYTYNPMALESGGESRLALGVRATPNYFALLGVEPALGRLFDPGAGGGEDVAVLSDLAWRRRFGADPGVIGRNLRLNGRSYTVVGVAPPRFFGLTRGIAPEVWVPVDLRRQGPGPPAGRALRWLWVVGRLLPAADPASARDEVRALGERFAREAPATNAERALRSLPLQTVRILPGVDARLRAASALLLGVVGLVLLVVCGNVAHLFLARALARQGETATRRALGAGTWAIARPLLAESLLLALIAGALGLLLARAAGHALLALRLPLPLDLALDLSLDRGVFLFAFLCAFASALAVGVAPALAGSRSDLSGLLRAEGTGGGSPAQRRLGALLVALQVALSSALLIVAGLALRSLAAAQRIDPGFEPRGIAVASVAPRLAGLSREATGAFFDRLLEQTRALPGVTSAALASHLPLTLEIRYDPVATPTDPSPPLTWPAVDSALVGPGYLETLRIPLLRGRGFTAGDREAAPPVAMVNRELARRLWPGADPIGRRLRVAGVDGEPEVVGLVGNGKYRTLGEEPRPFLYLSLAQLRFRREGRSGEITSGTETLLVRGSRPAAALLADLRTTIHRLDDRVPIARLESLERSLGVSLFLPRLAAELFGALGLLTLLVATLGLYSLMLYTTGQRRRELGLRAALGATRGELERRVVMQGVRLAAFGLAPGLALGALAARAPALVLYGIRPTDPWTFLLVAALLTGVAALASYLPARRSARRDPAEALRL